MIVRRGRGAIKIVGEIEETGERKADSTRKNEGSREQGGKIERVGAKSITKVRERDGRAKERPGKEMNFRR